MRSQSCVHQKQNKKTAEWPPFRCEVRVEIKSVGAVRGESGRRFSVGRSSSVELGHCAVFCLSVCSCVCAAWLARCVVFTLRANICCGGGPSPNRTPKCNDVFRLFGRMRAISFCATRCGLASEDVSKHFRDRSGAALLVHLNALEECTNALGHTRLCTLLQAEEVASRSESRLNFK